MPFNIIHCIERPYPEFGENSNGSWHLSSYYFNYPDNICLFFFGFGEGGKHSRTKPKFSVWFVITFFLSALMCRTSGVSFNLSILAALFLLIQTLSLMLPDTLTALNPSSVFCLVNGNWDTSSIKSRLFHTNVLSVLLYGRSLWKLSTNVTNQYLFSSCHRGILVPHNLEKEEGYR